MSGLGGLNKAPDGVVIGLVQIQIPVVVDAGRTWRAQTDRDLRAGRQGAAQHARPWTWSCSPNTPCTACRWTPTRRSCAGSTGPRSRRSAAPASRNDIWGCFSHHGAQPARQPVQQRASSSTTRASSSSITARCTPGCRSSPGSPATSASRSATGPTASKLALIICHDGMFPEMARECAYKGANIMLRTAGYTAPIRHALALHQPGQRLLQPDVHGVASACAAATARSTRWAKAMIVNSDGTPLVDRQRHRPTRSSPPRCGRACATRRASHWGVENNIYQLGHRGYVAVKGGARDCPYTFMRDLVAGRYALPWEDEVKVHATAPAAASPRRRASSSPCQPRCRPGKLAAE